MADTAPPPPINRHVEVQRRNTLIIVTSVLSGFGTLAVMLRMYARGVLIRALGKDDWTMFAAWLFLIAYVAVLGISVHFGTGLRQQDFKPEWLEPTLKMVLVIEALYYFAIYFIKTSILFFYLRLGRQANDTFHRLSKGTVYLLTVFLGVCIIVVFLQCQPIEKNWKSVEYASSGRCINTTAFFYSTSVFNIITDFWILGLPLKMLWHVQRPTMEKYALIAVFIMGIFACVASCVRLYSIRLFTESSDPLFDAVYVNIWSMIEINVAIVCASVPALKALVSMTPRTNVTTSSITTYGSSSSGTRSKASKLAGSIANSYGLNSLSHAHKLSSVTTTPSGGGSEERIAGVEIKEPNSGVRHTNSDEELYTYGYGVRAVHDGRQGQKELKEGGMGGIVFQQDVEVRSERRADTGLRERDVDVEEGHRYGARPGRRGAGSVNLGGLD